MTATNHVSEGHKIENTDTKMMATNHVIDGHEIDNTATKSDGHKPCQ